MVTEHYLGLHYLCEDIVGFDYRSEATQRPETGYVYAHHEWINASERLANSDSCLGEKH